MRLGVIVGRFQVPELHDGHVKLVEHVRQQHGQVLILLGVSPVLGSKRNPLDYATRQKMIQEKFPDVLTAPLPDMPTNEAWSQNLDKIVHSVIQMADVVLYGGKDSFIPFYKGQFKTMEIELELSPSGTDVRTITANRVRVSSDFRAGVIYNALNQYPRIFPTVDVAILKFVEADKKAGKGSHLLLLGRKQNMDGWCFPGGFVGPTDESYEDAARREALEETGVECPTLDYVCSLRGVDWRYKHIDDGFIVTTLFACTDAVGTPKAGDDLDQVKFFMLDDISPEKVISTHRPLLKKIVESYDYQELKPRGWSDHGTK